ncbi:murein hydrolase activator EnvC [Brevundimonas sp. G8]|uniref:murein hydrolase activator EnvC family protein n=1 Tax=Brevundimonas sp. G8 TaxID=1350776 RepID=UPI0012F2878F|nr:peptidoglycan DD-metalloendopeptidase family protein [Brevundimonas sp. G8]VXB91825.1 Peptidase M23 [Brevundimonas sp. G8]
MRRAIPLSLALLTGFVCAVPAVGRQAPESELSRIQAEYRDETVRARRLRADADAAKSELAQLERRLALLRADEQTGDRQIDDQRARLQQLTEREAELVTDLARERGAQGRLLSALQMMSRRPPPPLLVPADKAIDTVRASILLKAMTPDLENRAKALGARQAEIMRIRRLAVLSSERLLTTESEQGDRRGEIEGLTSRKTALTAVLNAEARAAERAAAVLERRIRELGGAVPTTQAAETPTARLPAGRARLSPPLSGAPSQTWGAGTSGWRWRADRAAVTAPADAKVAYAGPLTGWGNVVVLDLGPGWRAVIAGLDSVDVGSDVRVSDGQTLGRSGPDGDIYFELRRDERPIDPGPWLQ